MMHFDEFFMNDELQKKNDALQKKNEELEAEIRALQHKFDDFVDLMETHFDEQKKAQKILFNELESYITGHIIDRDTALQQTDRALRLKSKALEIQDGMIEYQRTKIEKYKKAPKVNKQNTDTLWEPYRQKFDDYIADGKTESWAKNKIGELMEKDGTWKKTSKKDSQKISTRPDRATLHRQLVTNRK